MLLASWWAFVADGGFVELEAPIHCELLALSLKCQAFLAAHRGELFRKRQVLLQYLQGINSTDQYRNRETHCVPDRLVGFNHTLLHRSSVAIETLHADGGDPAL